MMPTAQFLSEPQIFGCPVVTITSQCGGTGKTSWAYNMLRGVLESGSDKKILFLDASLSGNLGTLLGISGSHQAGLNDLFGQVPTPQSHNPNTAITNYKSYIIPISDHVHFLSSTLATNTEQETDLAYFPRLVARLRKEYDLIIIDTMSGRTWQLLPVLVVSNHVLIPHLLGDGRPQIIMAAESIAVIAWLRIGGYPIKFGGLIPIGFQVDNKRSSNEYEWLKKNFGSVIWPAIPYENTQEKADIIFSSLPDGLDSQEILIKFASAHHWSPSDGNRKNCERLLKLTRPRVTKPETRALGIIIYEAVFDPYEFHVSREIAKHKLSASETDSSIRYQVENARKELTIFTRKSPGEYQRRLNLILSEKPD